MRTSYSWGPKGKNELSPRSDSASLTQLNPIHKKGSWIVFLKIFFEAPIYCAYSNFGNSWKYS